MATNIQSVDVVRLKTTNASFLFKLANTRHRVNPQMQPQEPQLSSQKQPHPSASDISASSTFSGIDDDPARPAANASVSLNLRIQQTAQQIHPAHGLTHPGNTQSLQQSKHVQNVQQYPHVQSSLNGQSPLQHHPIPSSASGATHFTASSAVSSAGIATATSSTTSSPLQTPITTPASVMARLAIDTTLIARKPFSSIVLCANPTVQHHVAPVSPSPVNRSHAYGPTTVTSSTARSASSQSTGTTGHLSVMRTPLLPIKSTETNQLPSPSPVSPTKLGFVGKMILRKPGSIAFFVDLLSADRPSPKAVSPASEYLESLEHQLPSANIATSPRSLMVLATPTTATTMADGDGQGLLESGALTNLEPSTCVQRVDLHATPLTPQDNVVDIQVNQQKALGHETCCDVALLETQPNSQKKLPPNTIPKSILTLASSTPKANQDGPGSISSTTKSHPKLFGSRVRSTTPQDLRDRLNSRHARASAIRCQLIEERRTRLRRQAERVGYRIVLQRQRDRLQSLQQQAKNEYTMTAANLKRQMILRRMQERLGAAVEHAHSVMLMQKLRKFLDLRRAFSENFADVIKESLPSDNDENTKAELFKKGAMTTTREHPHASQFTAGLDLFIPDTEEEYQADAECTSISMSPPSSTADYKTDSSVDQTETAASPVKQVQKLTNSDKTRQGLMLDNEDKLYSKGFKLKETVSSLIRKSKSMSSMLLVDADDFTYLELLNLLPPVTRFTLRELELDEILSNAQLRHDLVFDPDLQFKPNIESDQKDERAQKADVYWEEVSEEIEEGYKYRIPLLLAEVRAILIELLPNGQDIKSEIDANIDVKLMAQQIDHGVMNPLGLIEYISGLMKINCAPIRDQLVDSMVAACKQGDFVQTLRICFDVLELMKLDYANHQLTRLRPYVIEHQTEFEWKWFKTQYESGSTTLDTTRSWLETVFKSPLPANTLSATPASTSNDTNLHQTDMINDAFLQLILQASQFSKKQIVPETLKMDTSRMISFYNDWQDITILSSLLVIFRQAAGPKCISHMDEAKKMLWVLLNDSDTTMSHISLQVAHTAGKIREKPFTEKETEMVSSMMEKTLAPNSKLYDLIQKRVGENLKKVIVNGVTDKDMMGKHGLAQLETEVLDLGIRIRKVMELNRAVFGRLYIALLDDITAGADGVTSPSAAAVLSG
ncbi:hypothetical protein BDEG_25273 [Batrachochytrium dendrobatidis JEL423]|nr:hypothetical protein BDEG_25273 [Batrachochytrium dendrobatidis JEL423]